MREAIHGATLPRRNPWPPGRPGQHHRGLLSIHQASGEGPLDLLDLLGEVRDLVPLVFSQSASDCRSWKDGGRVVVDSWVIGVASRGRRVKAPAVAVTPSLLNRR